MTDIVKIEKRSVEMEADLSVSADPSSNTDYVKKEMKNFKEESTVLPVIVEQPVAAGNAAQIIVKQEILKREAADEGGGNNQNFEVLRYLCYFN